LGGHRWILLGALSQRREPTWRTAQVSVGY
jgi:hypothetical protein